jgi:hypothetical protein
MILKVDRAKLSQRFFACLMTGGCVFVSCGCGSAVGSNIDSIASVTATPATDNTASTSATSAAAPLPEPVQPESEILPVSASTVDSPPSADPVASEKVVDNSATILGSWTDHFHGKRIMTFHGDRSGVMILELDTVGAMLYGSKLEFDFTWTLVDNILEMKMAGGRPKATVESLSKSWGAEHCYQVFESTPELLVIKNDKSKTICKLKPHQPVAQTAKPVAP